MNFMRRPTIAVVTASMLVCGCAYATNYEEAGPRYAAPLVTPAPLRVPDTLRVVSFNIAFARQIDSAIVVLRAPELRDADVVLLQEMYAPGTARIASALGMGYVYYPATKHPKTRRDFGNAVLSRWPIVEDRKIILPHVALIGQTQRIATGATLQIGDIAVRVYSAHLGTVANINFEERSEQIDAIMADAERYQHVIIGGDMNDSRVGRVARENGYAWPTQYGPRTATATRLDHVFLKGIAPALSNGAGTVVNNHHASDHRPIWALAVLR
jgi:endonuclease/exonuclease/phosphatase family metal-dependent hydrolase